MAVTSLQLIDLDVILRTWNNVAGKIVRKKGKAINDVNSYQFISNDANISLTDYEIVGTISEDSTSYLCQYAAQNQTIGQYINASGSCWSITGSSQQDEIHTSAEHSVVNAGAGNDTIYLGNHAIVVNGGAGNDKFYLHYGGGDAFTGGNGADTYVLRFRKEYGDTTNLITDFNIAEDKLETTKDLSKLGVSIKSFSGYYNTGFNSDYYTDSYFSGITVTLTDENQQSISFILKGLTDLTAAKNIKLISGNTTTTLSTLGSPLPVGLSYNKDKTVLTVSSAYAQDILNAADYSATVKTINAQNATPFYSLSNEFTIYGNSNANTIYGSTGNDQIYGEAGNDSIYGGKGDDIIRGGAGNDVFYYAKGDGNDIIEGFEAGKDKIRYTSGSLSKAKIGITDVSLYNGNGCQILTKMSPKGQYADIIGTDGKTTRHNFGSYTANNTWNYIAGQGFHGGKAKIDTLTVTGGKSYNINLADASHYTSIDKVDASKATAAMTITGGEEANTLIGGNKNDLIKGGAGNDSLYGGKGNDTLYGGSGNDTFYYAQNDGNDTIADFTAGTDKIRYTSGSLSKVLISGNDVLLYNGTGYQKLSGKAVKGQYADIIGTNGKSVRHNFGKNATANNWNYSAGQGYHGSTKTDTLIVTSITSYNINLSNTSLYTSIDNVDASESTAAMTITGSSSANTIEGSKKSDLIKGGAGNDTIKGGAGDDTLYGNAGKDVLYGGKGKDILYGGTENDTLHGGKGNDTLYGETGNDTLYGGKGNDILYGGAGNDVFYYARDDGNDTIKDFEAGKDKIRYTSGKLDQVKLVGKDVLLYNDIGYQKLIGKATKGQYADIIGINGISVRHNFGTNAMANNWNYTAGQGYHGSSKIDTLTITGTKSQSINLANQSLYTSIDNVNASKAKVDMTIRGTASANTLIGGAGDDTLIGGAGNDNLQGGSGDDELYAQSGNNTLYGGAGDDTLKGGTGTDILRGNTGNDIIFGGKGVDKIQYYKGDGNDIIIGANKKDVLYLYNISNIKTQAKFTLVGNSLVMNFTNNKNDTITLSYWSTTGMNNFIVGGKTYHLNQTNGKISVK